MGSACGKMPSKLVEPVRAVDESISTGDLVLVRLACTDADGLEVPVEVMREMSTATLGDQVSARRKLLPSWDRAGVALIQTRNGADSVYVVLSEASQVQVVRMSELMEDPRYGVIAVRELSPRYDPEPEEASLAELIDSRFDAVTPLQRAVRELENVEYNELVKKTKDDSVLQVFDHVQKWCMDKVQTGSTAEYREQLIRTGKKKKRTERAHTQHKRTELCGGVEASEGELDLSAMSNLDLKAMLTSSDVSYTEALQQSDPRGALIRLIRGYDLHIKKVPQKDLGGEAEAQGAPAEAAPAAPRRTGFRVTLLQPALTPCRLQ
eukprot:TRINITY_DN2824_c0_g3_i8.p1 TRINITY_DN2824_c0_g3~~TRINITY_DN2824_c0_g3_i8.p1  ORF type:complete len:322 (+),score=96.63 TRINITY_DN2824_c0_g3_i8:92-1057(+)